MIKLLFSTFMALICLGAASGDITHSRLDDAHLFTNSFCNFAIANWPDFYENQWKTVTVNAKDVVVMTPSCQVITKNMLTMSKDEKEAILTAKYQFEEINKRIHLPAGASEPIDFKASSCRYSPNGDYVGPSKACNINVASYTSDGLSTQMYDEDNFSLSKSSFPSNLARIFVSKDVVTYTYRDGKIEMKPQACLNDQEKLTLEEYKASVLESKERMAESQYMHQDMHQQMMQKMMQMYNDRLSYYQGFDYERQNLEFEDRCDLSAETMHNQPPQFEATQPQEPWHGQHPVWANVPAAPQSNNFPPTQSTGYNPSASTNPYAAATLHRRALSSSRPYIPSDRYASKNPSAMDRT